MAKSDTRLTVINVINIVQRKLGINESTSLTANKQVKVLLQQLNDTIDEISDFGDWQEMYQEVTVPTVSGQKTYGLGVPYPIKNLYEIAYYTRPQSLYNVEIEEINRLNRSSGSGTGEPRQFAVKGIDTYGNPSWEVYPRPGTVQNGKYFTVAFYRKPRNYTFNSLAEEIEFPGNLVVLGVHWRALAYENNGQMTDQAKQIRDQFALELNESLNRFTGDTGTFVQLTPVNHTWKMR